MQPSEFASAVYFADGGSFLKVGHCAKGHVDSRLATLQHQTPFELRLLAALNWGSLFDEQKILVTLADANVRTEWFYLQHPLCQLVLATATRAKWCVRRFTELAARDAILRDTMACVKEVDVDPRRVYPRVTELRKERGWDLGRLAQEAGVSTATLGSGKHHSFSGITLGKIARALGVPPRVIVYPESELFTTGTPEAHAAE